MKTECIIKSVKSDVRDIGILIGILFIIGIIGWVCLSNWDNIISSKYIGHAIFIIFLIIVDLSMLHLSGTPLIINVSPRNLASLSVTLIIYLIMIGVMFVTTLSWTTILQPPAFDLSVILIINSLFLIPTMIIYRVYIRCNWDKEVVE